MKVLKSVMMGIMGLMVMASTVNFIKANENRDTDFKVYVDLDGSDGCTVARPKKDNTYTYIRLDSGASLRFAAQAKRGIKAGQLGDPEVHNYSSAWHTLKAGKRTYIKNLTHDRGIANTYLTMNASDGKKHTYKGAWSPDNISGFGEP